MEDVWGNLQNESTRWITAQTYEFASRRDRRFVFPVLVANCRKCQKPWWQHHFWIRGGYEVFHTLLSRQKRNGHVYSFMSIGCREVSKINACLCCVLLTINNKWIQYMLVYIYKVEPMRFRCSSLNGCIKVNVHSGISSAVQSVGNQPKFLACIFSSRTRRIYLLVFYSYSYSIPTKLLYSGCVEVKRVFLATELTGTGGCRSDLGEMGGGRREGGGGLRTTSNSGGQTHGWGAGGGGCSSQQWHAQYIAVKSVFSTFYAA